MTAAGLDPGSWNLLTSASITRSFVAGATLAGLADADPRIVVLGADLKYSNRTSDFAERHPGRFFNLGIAEQNMISVAAGMASFGLIPYVGTFASYAGLLCAEQIRTDLAYTGMRVRVLAHHAGISLGYYGTSHHATEDVAILRSIAGVTVVAPCDARSLDAALRQTVEVAGPVYLRLGRGRDPDVYQPGTIGAWRLGRANWLADGADLTVPTDSADLTVPTDSADPAVPTDSADPAVPTDSADLAVLAYGSTVAPALEAARAAAADGIAVAVADVHTLKPLDFAAVARAARARCGILVAEEHNTIGGLATAVADVLADQGISARLHRIGIPDEYAPVGPPTHLYRHYGLDTPGILARIKGITAGRG